MPKFYLFYFKTYFGRYAYLFPSDGQSNKIDYKNVVFTDETGRIQFVEIYHDAPFADYWMIMTLMKDFSFTYKQVLDMPLTIAYGYYDSLLKNDHKNKSGR